MWLGMGKQSKDKICWTERLEVHGYEISLAKIKKHVKKQSIHEMSLADSIGFERENEEIKR